MPAVVLGEIGLVRCLGEGGIPCTVVACNKDHLAFASRYCIESVVVPSFDPDCCETLDLLLKIGRRLGKAVLFCNGEPDFLFVSKNRDRLSRYFLIDLPSEKQADLLVDKGRFYQMGAEYGFPIPRTWQPIDPDALETILPEIVLPCILKPMQQVFWKSPAFEKRYGMGIKALQAEDAEALRTLYRDLWSFHPGVLIQEYIPGGDDHLYFFDTYFNARSEPLGYFIARRIRTYPIHCGISTLAVTVHDPAIAKAALQVLQTIGYRGAAHLDFKRDSRDGTPRLLEINPRFGLAIDLGARAGVNLPMRAYLAQLGRPLRFKEAYRAGINWIDTKSDLKALQCYRKTEEWTLSRWLRSLRGPKMFRIWSARDPAPALTSIRRFLKRQIRRWIGSLAPSKTS
jgi:predicted ATP-grasp superfamily ATP-dependent carboligase